MTTELNLFRGDSAVAGSRGTYVRFENLLAERAGERRARLQSIANILASMGVDSAVVHGPRSEFDLLLLWTGEESAEAVLSKWQDLGPVLVETDRAPETFVEKAWQLRVRTHLEKRGLTRVGSDRYVALKDVRDARGIIKSGFRVQTVLSSGRPAVYVDPRSRVIEPITLQDVLDADGMGGESDLHVRVLPNWTSGILQGHTGRRAGETEFPLGSRRLKTPEYWRIKYGVGFVRADEEMVQVYLGRGERTFDYPISCVFREFERGTSLPEDLKKDPATRVRESSAFVRVHLDGVGFLGRRFRFAGPVSTDELGFAVSRLPRQEAFRVEVGGGAIVPVADLHRALKRHGPFAGPISGRYVVFHASLDSRRRGAFAMIASAYQALGFGNLEPYGSVGDGGFVDVGGAQAADFVSAITGARAELHRANDRLLAFLVLPGRYASEVYYKGRDALFEQLFGTTPLPVQGVGDDTLSRIAGGGQQAYPSSVNLASQSYIKIGGTGAAAWVLAEAADSSIPGIPPGATCYAYHDVSRRPRMKASATAYSAMTDAYGRYIATGAKPVGGEALTPGVFHDILIDLLRKVSFFGQRYGAAEGKPFSFQRLAFARDGPISEEQADMMEAVVLEGVPDEGKEPMGPLLERIPTFPKSLVIDVISVNKSPNKRLIEREDDRRTNVPEGTAVAYDDHKGLLVSCPAFKGTAQPLEVAIWKHLCINRPETPWPHIAQIMDEYYRQTYLDWASVFRQGKYALPQILTQNLGEHISAGVTVPEDMVLL
jgi:hypothetical protein